MTSPGNPAYRTKASIQAAALAGLEPEMITDIVFNAARRARSGTAKDVSVFLKLLQTLGISKVNPDRVNKDEISSLMGNPTDSLMKRIRPGKPPEIRKEETA